MSFYKTTIVVRGEKADSLASNLWHFVNLCSSFSFEVNGNSFTFLSKKAPQINMIKENEDNFFTLFFDAHNEDTPKEMEILDHVLSLSYAPLSFVLVDE